MPGLPRHPSSIDPAASFSSAVGVGLAGIWKGSLLILALGLVAPDAVKAQVVINEVLAKNTFTNFDDEGKASDWVELRNLGGQPVDLLGFTLTDDPAVPDKWVFPEVEIPAGGFLLVWLSGKDRYVPPPSVIDGSSGLLAFDPRFVQRETPWRYLLPEPGPGQPPGNWNEIGFDDGGWLLGSSGFGYGDGDDFTELPGDTTVVFTRKEFEVPDPSVLTNLVFQIDYDDGFIAYLNGERLADSGADPGEPTFESRSDEKHEAGTPERFDFTSRLDLLRPGTNVLAVVGLNDTPSSDMSLIPELGVIPLVLHSSFKLDAEGGELLMLRDADGALRDQIQLPLQTEDHSYGRALDRGGEWAYFLTPTPDAANTSRSFTEAIADRVSADPEPGIFQGTSLEVSFSTSLPGLTEIRYTTDGSQPTLESPLYEGPIAIDRSTTFTTAGFIEGERATRVVASSYFLGERFTLPIFSISMDPADYSFVHNTSGARGRSSEREAFLEILEADGTRSIAQGLGIRLHGGAGRGGDFQTKKSYKVYFRGVYGAKKLEYPLLPDSPVEVFDKLVLRGGFNDSYRTNGRSTYLRDQLIRDLHEDMGALVSHGTWCMLFVNQRFRGLYNVVERMDEEFLASYFEGDDWDVIKTGNDVLVGTREEWDRLRQFALDRDLDDPVQYRQFEDLLDLDNFTSYMILNMWAQNHDWPHNNWYAARRREPGSKWIFLSWDAEFGIGLNPQGFGADSFSNTLGRNGYLRDILVELLESEEYRARFIDDLEWHLSQSLHPENTLVRLERLVDIVEPDIQEELDQFGRTAGHWMNNVQAMRTFLNNRNEIFLDHVRNSQQYDFPEPSQPVIDRFTPLVVVNDGEARVRIEGRRLSGTSVFFGELEAATVRGVDEAIIATLPLTAALQGQIQIRVISRDSGEESVAADMLEVMLPVPEPTEIFPASARPGDLVFIQGRNFLEGIEVHFGPGNLAESVEVNPFGPPGPGLDELSLRVPEGTDRVTVQLVNTVPGRLPSVGGLEFTFETSGFVRGDANDDGKSELVDAIFMLEYLFRGRSEPSCLKAIDVDDNGSVELTDPVSLLSYLFLGTFEMPAPHPGCGVDPVDDVLTCHLDRPCP